MRSLALMGAQIVLHPANLVCLMPGCHGYSCIENRVFEITANRIGVERGLKFTGLVKLLRLEV